MLIDEYRVTLMGTAQRHLTSVLLMSKACFLLPFTYPKASALYKK